MTKVDFVPQAIVGDGIFELAKRFNFELTKGHDDLDEFYGAAFMLDDFIPFALMHYHGHEKDTSTIYLPYDVDSIDEISKFLKQIISEFKLSDRLVWQRSNELKGHPPKSTPR